MLVRRVLLVNAQPIFRSGLRLAVEAAGGFHVTGEAASGYQAMQEAERTRPDLLLVDADLPGMSGYAIVSALLRPASGRTAVILADRVDQEIWDRSVACGAVGAIPARIGPDQLVRTLRRMANQQPFFWEPERPWGRNDRTLGGKLSTAGLTMREIEVLDCVAQGFSNRDIAEALFVNEQTVKNHLTSIFRKLNVDDRVQALIFSIKRGWVDFSASG